jgi:hypothetical protein
MMHKSLRLLVLALVLLPAIGIMAPEAHARNAAAPGRPTVTIAKSVLAKDTLRGLRVQFPDVKWKATVIFHSFKLSVTRRATNADGIKGWARIYVTPFWATLEARGSRMITYEGEPRRVCPRIWMKSAGFFWKQDGKWRTAFRGRGRQPAKHIFEWETKFC